MSINRLPIQPCSDIQVSVNISSHLVLITVFQPSAELSDSSLGTSNRLFNQTLIGPKSASYPASFKISKQQCLDLLMLIRLSGRSAYQGKR